MKKLSTIILLTLCLALLSTGCNYIFALPYAPGGDETDVQYLPKEFGTLDDFFEYVLCTDEIYLPLLTRAEQEKLPSGQIRLYKLATVPNGFEFESASHSGNYISYSYVTAEPVNRELREKLSQLADDSIARDNEKQPEASPTGNKTSSAGEPAEPRQETGEDYNDQIHISTHLTLSWAFAGDGELLMKDRIERLELKESGVPGYYYSDGGYPYSLSIYWVENNYCFQLNFPLESEELSPMEIIQKYPEVFHVGFVAASR